MSMDRRTGANRTLEILMAVYNGEAYLRTQIDSILAQTDSRWHMTVSDDGSSDSSPRIIEEYAGKYPQRIACHHPPRRFGNARDHFFYLLSGCRADYVLFSDQDDVWYPDKLKRTREAMEAAERAFGEDTPILVFSDQVPTDEALNPLGPSLMRYQKQYFGEFDYRSLLMQNVVTGGAMGINRALALLGGRGEGDSRVIMHDWWLATVAARFGRIVYIDEPLGIYRQHGNNTVGAKHVGSLSYIAGRLASLRDVRQSIRAKKAQAQAFHTVYAYRLDVGDIAFLSAFERERSGPGFYFRYGGKIHGLIRKLGFALMG